MRKKLTIVMEGGFISTIVSDEPADFADTEIEIVDYDVEGADARDLTPVLQANGTYEYAYVLTVRAVQPSEIQTFRPPA